MRLRWVPILFLAVAADGCSAPAHGAPVPWKRLVLVELFTSQGCSSCPPADAFVGELPALGLGRDKVIPLTFHVDYWDRLGWKDPFANPDFTQRQDWYSRSKMLRSPEGRAAIEGIYTPQMIVDGVVHFSGQRRRDAVREMERAADRPPLFALTADATAHGSSMEVSVEVSERGVVKRDLDWRLVVALVATKARTSVTRGENAGETLDEAAVVRALSDRISFPVARGSSTTIRLTKPSDLSWSEIVRRWVRSIRGDPRDRGGYVAGSQADHGQMTAPDASDTVSTHVLQPMAVAALARWGLLERLTATGCPPVSMFVFDVDSGALVMRAATFRRQRQLMGHKSGPPARPGCSVERGRSCTSPPELALAS